jgi:hypothetical protein
VWPCTDDPALGALPMRKHKSVRVRVGVTPTGGKAATKTLTLRR